MYLNKYKQRGFASVILVIGVILVLVVVGYFYFSQTSKSDEDSVYVDKYTNSNEKEISDSDNPEVIEGELEETELMISDFEKDLDDLDAELNQL